MKAIVYEKYGPPSEFLEFRARLKNAYQPPTTMELQVKTKELVPYCVAVIVLNFLRIRGTIRGKHEDLKRVWWV